MNPVNVVINAETPCCNSPYRISVTPMLTDTMTLKGQIQCVNEACGKRFDINWEIASVTER